MSYFLVHLADNFLSYIYTVVCTHILIMTKSNPTLFPMLQITEGEKLSC